MKLDALPPPSDNSSHDLSDVPHPSDVDNEADMDDLLPPTDTESEVEVALPSDDDDNDFISILPNVPNGIPVTSKLCLKLCYRIN